MRIRPPGMEAGRGGGSVPAAGHTGVLKASAGLLEQMFRPDGGAIWLPGARIARTAAHRVAEKRVQIGHAIAHAAAELAVGRPAATAPPTLQAFHTHIQDRRGLPFGEEFVHCSSLSMRDLMSRARLAGLYQF